MRKPSSGRSARRNRRAKSLGWEHRFAAVLDDLRGSPPAAVVLLSDGINTDGPDLAEAARYATRKGVPLYTVGLGDDRPVKDVKLTDLLVDDTVFVDDIVYFEAKLAATGYQGQEVQVVLREQGKRDVLARLAVKLGPDGQSQQVRIPYRPTKEGEFRYVVEAEPLEGEVQAENNRQQCVRVRKEKYRYWSCGPSRALNSVTWKTCSGAMPRLN